MAAYEIRWSDIQVQSTDKTGAFLFTTNAGTGKVDGIEIEASAVLAPGLVLDFGGAYTKARLTSDPPPVPVSDPNFARSGDRFPGVPQTQFSAALTYSVPVMAEGNLSVRADLTHRGSTNTQFNTGSKFAVPLASYDLFNLRASLDWRNWQFSAFAKNLFDKRAEVDAISSDQDPLARITVRPRTVGVGLSYKF